MTPRSVELRSDTFTRPTDAMRRAMYEAEVGDDVWGEDPTVRRLQELAAELTGQEAALYVSSGTQGNLVALLSHTRPGNEVIVGEDSHIFLAESGGAAVVGGLQLRPLPNEVDGRIYLGDIRAAMRDASDAHNPPTGAVALENTHNFGGGTVLRRDEMAAVAAVAHEAGVPLHLDGARIFNAAVALGLPLGELIAPVDSVTFCLSKGLGAPIGSVLCGATDFIGRAHRWRKLLGGGMRQVGILAAAGIYALQHNVERLAEDHANARRLAEGLVSIPLVEVDDPEGVESNIVFFDIGPTGVAPREFVSRLAELGVRLASSTTRFRAMTSLEVSRDDIEYALGAIRLVVQAPVVTGA